MPDCFWWRKREIAATIPDREASEVTAVLERWEGRLTHAIVDLDAIAANVRALKRHSAPARFMAVVKANAYGHGAAAVARAAESAGAEWAGVYTVSEGAVLRRAGIGMRILVLGPFRASEVGVLQRYGLSPTISHCDDAELLRQHLSEPHYPFHLKVDTGLHRSGVAPEEAPALMEWIVANTGLRSEGLMTHLASSDEADKSLTHQQFRVFQRVAADLRSKGHVFDLYHVSNSGATLDLPDLHLDMVRPGICLYGYYPSADVSRSVSLQPALQLHSAVRRVHVIQPGDGVGYGHEFRAIRPTSIALVPIGYGDGLPRTLGNGRGQVIVRSRLVPIVGRVSMDQITLDVTDIPDVVEGDVVTLIGRQGNVVQTAEDLAGQSGTISYDILTGLLPRVPRLYVRDGMLVGAEDLLPESAYSP